MQLGMIGLGRMGANIVRRLMRAGHDCVVFDRDPAAGAALAREAPGGRQPCSSWCRSSSAPRAVWVMVPAGEATESTVARACGVLAARRHHHRRRQLLLEGRRPPRRRAEAQGPALRRCRHHRRRLGPGARLLPDDRRREGRHRASRPDLQRAGAGPRRHPRDARPRGPRPARRAGLPACGPQRRRPLRQDDPQRHRVRHDAGHGRGLRHPEARQFAEACARAAPRSRRRRHRRGLAPRQRRHLLAARSDGDGAGAGPATCSATPATSRIPARAAGPCRPPSSRRCRPRC